MTLKVKVELIHARHLSYYRVAPVSGEKPHLMFGTGRTINGALEDLKTQLFHWGHYPPTVQLEII